MHRKYILPLLAVLLILPTATLLAKQTKDPLVELGRFIFEDMALSFNNNQSCKVCHHPSAGTEDPDNSREGLPVSAGSIEGLFGGRNAPSAAYAAFSPKFNADEMTGGLFWDGRATGMNLTVTGGLGAGPTGDPLADQAKGPFLNPVEMALDCDSVDNGLCGEEAVVDVILRSDYAARFLEQYEAEYGTDYFYDTDDGPGPDRIDKAYNLAAVAIAAFERSVYMIPFNSKFDRFVAEQKKIDPEFDVSSFGVILVPCGNAIREDGKCQLYDGPPANFKSKIFNYDEAIGLALFNADSFTQLGNTLPLEFISDGGMCYACHPTANHAVPEDNNAFNPPNVMPGTYPAVFTDFTYDNLGIPVNPAIAELLGGPQPIDYGLGKVGENPLITGDVSYCKYEAVPADATCDETVLVDPDSIGLFKVPTLRNVARSAPYGHNGRFPTLTDIVQFYNVGNTAETGAPEVPHNVNRDELGNLGLDADQIAKLVIFMETLSDDFD